MPVGIIAAMDEEVQYLLEAMTDQQTNKIANCFFIEGNLKGTKIVLVKSGIGKVNAALATTILHENYKPTFIINTGSAGGLHEALSIGDVVVSTAVVHHDVDATGFDYLYGQVPGMPKTYESAPPLIEKTKETLKKLQIPHQLGMIGTGDSFINDEKRLAFIQSVFKDVIAVEMEAAAIAQICYQYETPFVVIRAISDIAGKEATVSFQNFLKLAAKRASDFIQEMLEAYTNKELIL